MIRDRLSYVTFPAKHNVKKKKKNIDATNKDNMQLGASTFFIIFVGSESEEKL